MQKLFWIGSPFFSDSLAACGWDVRVYNFNDISVFGWQGLVQKAGFEPEVLVVADKSRPPFVLGMENFPCLTVFYAVDTHIHSWYPLYGQAFDICMVSLKDDIPLFLDKRLPPDRVWWSPPYARNNDQPNPAISPDWDCLFVGSVNETMPRRREFLQHVHNLVPTLQVKQGDYRKLYPHARMVLNQCEHGDMNFRIFEAMGCGRCLLTPRIGHDLVHMFVDGEHTVMYEPDNAEDVATKVAFLLDDAELTEYIAGQGKLAIDAGHRAMHRAQAFTDNMCDILTGDPQGLIQDRITNAARIREVFLQIPYLHLAEQMPFPQLQEAYLAAAKGKFND